MNKNVQDQLNKFAADVGDTLIATGVVDFDGGLEAYVAHDVQGKDYNVQRSASLFAMIVNILNKVLDEVYEKKEFVDEVLVTTKDSYFLVRMIEKEKHYHGITFSATENIDRIRELTDKYRPEFARELG